MWTISAINKLNVFIAPSSLSTPNMISGKHLSLAAGNFQILRNPGGTEHAQTVCTRLFFSSPLHESLGMRLTLIMAIQEHPYV